MDATRAIAEQAKDVEAQIDASRTMLRIAEQFTVDGNDPNVQFMRLVLRSQGLGGLAELAERDPERFAGTVLEDAAGYPVQTGIELRVYREVSEHLAAVAGTADGSEYLPMLLLMASAQMLLVVTLGLTLLFGLAALLRARPDRKADQVRWGWRAALCWIVGTGLSFLLLGMFPAEMVSADVQAAAARWGVWLGWISGWVAVVLGVLLRFIRRPFQLPWKHVVAVVVVAAAAVVLLRHRAGIVELGRAAIVYTPDLLLLLIVLAALGLIGMLGLWACQFARSGELKLWQRVTALALTFLLLLGADIVGLQLMKTVKDFKGGTWIQSRAWNLDSVQHVKPEDLQSTLKLDDAPWTSALVQWLAHRGIIAGALLSVALLLVWHLVRTLSRFEQGLRGVLGNFTAHLHRVGAIVARSSAAVALICLLVYLAIAPTITRAVDRYYRVHLGRLADSGSHWVEINAMQERVESDDQWMNRLRAENQD